MFTLSCSFDVNTGYRCVACEAGTAVKTIRVTQTDGRPILEIPSLAWCRPGWFVNPLKTTLRARKSSAEYLLLHSANECLAKLKSFEERVAASDSSEVVTSRLSYGNALVNELALAVARLSQIFFNSCGYRRVCFSVGLSQDGTCLVFSDSPLTKTKLQSSVAFSDIDIFEVYV